MMNKRLPKACRSTLHIFMVLLVVMLVFPESARPADPLALATSDDVLQDALKQVKDDLIAELSGTHEGLAKKLKGMDPEKIGDFLGTVAGGDYEGAFKVAGDTAANYFSEYFSEKAGELIPDDSPAGQILKYMPVSKEKAKAVYQKIWEGDYNAASNQFVSMLKTEGRASAEELSKDIISGGIDWVLKDLTGGSPGGLFIKIVELEMETIRIFDKRVRKYYSDDLLAFYNKEREKGRTAAQAYEALENALSGRMGATIPWNGMNDTQRRMFCETHYMEDHPELLEQLRAKRDASADAALSTIKREMDRERDQLFNALIRIATKYADNIKELKELIQGYKEAYEKLKAMESQRDSLYKYKKNIKDGLSEAAVEKIIREVEKQKTALEKVEAKASTFQKCSSIDKWTAGVDREQEGIDRRLEQIREIGKKSQDTVREVCGDKENEEKAKNGIIELKKRLGDFDALKTDIDARKKRASEYILEIKVLKTETGNLLTGLKDISGAIEGVRQAKSNLTTKTKAIDLFTKIIDERHGEIQKILAKPVFQKKVRKSTDIRYNILRDAQAVKDNADKIRGEIEGILSRAEEKFTAAESVIKELETSSTKIEEWAKECSELENLDPQIMLNTLNESETTFNKYRAALVRYIEKVRDCSDMSDEDEGRASLDEARRLLGLMRQAGGDLMVNNQIVDTKYVSLVALLGILKGAEGDLNAAASAVDGFVKSCNEAKTNQEKFLEEIKSTKAAVDADMGTLKKGYETAGNSSKQACELAQQAKNVEEAEKCRELASKAQGLVNPARQAAVAAAKAAISIGAKYGSLIGRPEISALDAIVRQVPAQLQAIESAVGKAEQSTSSAGSSAVNADLSAAEGAAAKVKTQRGIVVRAGAQIKNLLSGIAGKLAGEVQEILGNVANMEEIAERRSAESAARLVEAQSKAKECLAQEKAVMALATALKGKKSDLAACKSTGGGGLIDDVRATSDTAEIFGPAAAVKAEEAAGCAQQAGAACSSKTSGGGDESNPFEGGDDEELTGLWGGREGERNQQRTEREGTDQNAAGTRGPGRYGTEGLGENLGETLEGVKPKPPEEPTKDPEDPEEPTAGGGQEGGTGEEQPEPVTTAGIETTVVGEAPDGMCKIVEGQLVPVQGYKENIAGMTVTLAGKVSRSTSSSGGGRFSFPEIPAGDYTISVAEWDYGMTSAALNAPSGKAIKIVLKGSCPYLYVWTGSTYEQENDIYSTARIQPAEIAAARGDDGLTTGLTLRPLSLDDIPGELRNSRTQRDFYRISTAPHRAAGGELRMKIREQALEHSFTDQVRLLAVARPDEMLAAAVTREGRFFFYDELRPVAPQSVKWQDGSGQMLPVALFDGEWVDISLPPASFDGSVLQLRWQGFQDGTSSAPSATAGRPRIELQRLSPAGDWRTVDWIYPRDEIDKGYFVMETLGEGWDAGGAVRLVSRSCLTGKFHRVDGLAWGRLSPKEAVPLDLPLVDAFKEGVGTVTDRLLTADSRSLHLGPQEEVLLRFEGRTLGATAVYDYFFVSEGFYIPVPQLRVEVVGGGALIPAAAAR